MRTIWKYGVIDLNSSKNDTWNFELQLPLGSTPLCVLNVDGDIFIYADVDSEEQRTRAYKFGCLGTGHGKVPDGGKYLGSVVQGIFVWHVYQIVST